jgi:general secretion pathway protein M
MNTKSMALPPQLAGLRTQVQAFWRLRAPRERLILGSALLVIGVAIVWLVAVQPALRSVREAPAQLDQLDAQLHQMQRLALESKMLRDPVQISPGQAESALKAATERLGDAARLTVQGDRATLTVTGVQGAALRAWLGEARSAAHARAIDAQLLRNPQGYAGSVIVSFGAGS